MGLDMKNSFWKSDSKHFVILRLFQRIVTLHLLHKVYRKKQVRIRPSL